jgi:hypothetical protein
VCDRVRGCPDIPLFDLREHAKIYRQRAEVKARLKNWRLDTYGKGDSPGKWTAAQRANRLDHNRSKLVAHLNRRYDDGRRCPKPQARSIKAHGLVYEESTELWR